MKLSLIAPLLVLVGAASPTPQQPLLLQDTQGERRVRVARPGFNPQTLPRFTIKVDSRNGGSSQMVMLTENVPPSAVIPWHRHLHADEIVYTENGNIEAQVGGRKARLGPHATIFIPQNTWVTIRNAGIRPVRLIAVFDHPDFDAYLRCTSVPAGNKAERLNRSELARCMRLGQVEYR